MLTKTQKKNYLENVLLNGDLLDQPFSFFMEVIDDIIVKDKYLNYKLNKNLLSFTSLESDKQVMVPKYCIPIVLDLIKIAFDITISQHIYSNRVSLYQNMLKSDYEILKMIKKEEDREKEKRENENKFGCKLSRNADEYDILYLKDKQLDLFRNYDVYNLIKTLGITYTAYYFYLLYELYEMEYNND